MAISDNLLDSKIQSKLSSMNEDLPLSICDISSTSLIIDILDRLGQYYIKSGKEFRWTEHNSVTFRNNLWFRHSQQQGGMSVDFLINFFNYSYKNAVEFLLNEFEISVINNVVAEQAEFVVPTKAVNNNKVIDYLVTSRLIDLEVLNTFIDRGLIYENAKYHNCIFVGFSENDEIKHIHKRSQSNNQNSYRGNIAGSDTDYSFHYTGADDCLYVFESPIDLLSYVSLNKENWKQHHYVALCGVSTAALFKQLELYPAIKNVFLCLDNDIAGSKATERIIEELSSKDVMIEVVEPRFKDFNEDLKFIHNKPALGGRTDPGKSMRADLLTIVSERLNDSPKVSFKDLINDYSPFLYKYESKNTKVRIKSYDSLINTCIDSLVLAKQQYRHLGKDYTDQEMLESLKNSNSAKDRPRSKAKIKKQLVSKINSIKQINEDLMFHTEVDKLSLIEYYMSLANYCINAHVFLSQLEQDERK